MAGRLLESEGGSSSWKKVVAHSAGIKIGDDVRILTRGSIKPQHVQLVGLIRPTDIWAFTQGGLAYFNLEDWQWMWKEEGKIDALQLGLVPSVDKRTKTLGMPWPRATALELEPATPIRASTRRRRQQRHSRSLPN